MDLEVQVPLSALFRLFESNVIQEGMTRAVPGGAWLKLSHLPDTEALATLFVTYAATPAATDLFVNWLSAGLKNRGVTRIRINREEIEVTAKNITRKIKSLEIEETH